MIRELLSLAGAHKRAATAILLISTALYAALLVSHAKARKPWNDEAMSALAGHNLAVTGHTGVPFYDEKASGFTGVDRHTYYIFPLQLPVLAVWYSLAGFNLLTTRVLAMLWSFLMLAALYCALRKLIRDPAIAFTAAALTAFDYQIMLAASFGRYDSMVAALGFSGYALFLLLRERNLRLAILAANTAVVASGATHPNGFFYFLGLWFLILYYDRRRLGWKELAAAAVPYAVGGVFWARFILEDYPAFRAQMARNSGGRIGLLDPLATLIAEIHTRYMAAYGLGAHSAGHNLSIVKLKAVSLVAYLAGVVGCLAIRSIRTNPAYRALFILAGLHWFLLTFYENMKFSYYLVHLVPFYWSLAAVFAATLWRRGTVPKWAIAAGLAVAPLLQIGGIAARIRLDDYAHSYLPAVEYVRSHASPGDDIFAVCSFGFAYGFSPLVIDDDGLGFVSRRRPAFIVMEEIYDGQHEIYKTARPDWYAHALGMLNSYELVYRNSEYRVYRRPTAGLQPATPKL